MEYIKLEKKEYIKKLIEVYHHHYLYDNKVKTPFWSLRGISKSIDHQFQCKQWGDHAPYTYKEDEWTICQVCYVAFKV